MAESALQLQISSAEAHQSSLVIIKHPEHKPLEEWSLTILIKKII